MALSEELPTGDTPGSKAMDPKIGDSPLRLAGTVAGVDVGPPGDPAEEAGPGAGAGLLGVSLDPGAAQGGLSRHV